MEKICVVCGKSFITSGRRAKFCSYECSKVAGKSHRVKPDGWVYHGECLQCGKRFESTRTKKYCSAECQCNFQLNKAKMERLQAKPLCKQCGKQLPLKRSMFCSDACQKLSEKKTDIIWAPLTDEIIRQRIANHYDNIEHISGHKSDGRLIVRCKVCGGEFQMGERVTRKGNSDNIFPCPHCSKAKPVEPKRIVACAVCGKEFEGTKASKCCSNECRKVYARQYYSERARQIHEQISEEITCKQCGIVFTPEYGDKRKGFCSKECCKKYSHKYRKHYRESVTAYREKARVGFSGGVDRETMQTALEEKRQRAERAQKTLQKSKESSDDEITARVKLIVRTAETTRAPEPLEPLPKLPSVEESTESGKKQKPLFITDELSQYPKETRRVVGRIYDLINQNAPDIAQELIAKIHTGLKAKKD